MSVDVGQRPEPRNGRVVLPGHGGGITGLGVLSAAGDDPTALAAAVAASTMVCGRADGLYAQELPTGQAPVIADFDARATLGRKGTSFLDRATCLSLVACGKALQDCGLTVDDGNRHRVGVALGTTLGSLKSTMDYSCETLVQEKPYLVNPVLFPNTVMNCAAGQAAIRYGLRGVNATVAGGPLSFLYALRYALNALHRGYADAMLVGAVEEFTPHTAWAAALTGTSPAGEAAAVYVMRREAGVTAGATRPRAADVLAVTTGFCPDVAGGALDDALAGCVTRALVRAGVAAHEVWAVATGDRPGERREADAVRAVLPRECEELRVTSSLGDCQAASGALALAALIGRHRTDPALDGRPSVITGHSRDGAVAAAVVRGWSHVGDDRGQRDAHLPG